MKSGNDFQAKSAFMTVVIGIVFLLIAFLVSVFVFRDSPNAAETIVAVLGAVTGVLGTLVGYVAGQTGREKAVERAFRAERRLAAVLDVCEPGVLERARSAEGELFRD